MPNDLKLSHISGAKWLLLTVIVVMFDQLSKLWVLKTFSLHQSREILPVLNIYLDFNKGAAFSMLNSNPAIAMWLFGGIALVVSVILFVWLMFVPTDSQLQSAALSLILSGAVGNLIDRVRLGHVVDFVQLHIAENYWPTFNIADTAITIGAGILVLSVFMRKK